MLQQTQVETVLPFYRRWLERFPTLAALAAADEEEILEQWVGLGYYSRARNFHAAARMMSQAGLAQPPADPGELAGYPGIGPYTAGAIASIAYNLSHPAVDGNVERVLARFFDLDFDLSNATSKKNFKTLAASLIPEGRARDFNQALMELGALVCTPQKPRCDACPLAMGCKALAAGTISERPVSRPAPKTVAVHAYCVLLRHGGRILCRKRPPQGLWASFWEIPWEEKPARRASAAACAQAWLEERFSLSALASASLGSVSFSFTQYRVRMEGIVFEIPTPPAATLELPWGWFAHPELATLPLPSGSRKILKKLLAERIPDSSLW